MVLSPRAGGKVLVLSCLLLLPKLHSFRVCCRLWIELPSLKSSTTFPYLPYPRETNQQQAAKLSCIMGGLSKQKYDAQKILRQAATAAMAWPRGTKGKWEPILRRVLLATLSRMTDAEVDAVVFDQALPGWLDEVYWKEMFAPDVDPARLAKGQSYQKWTQVWRQAAKKEWDKLSTETEDYKNLMLEARLLPKGKTVRGGDGRIRSCRVELDDVPLDELGDAGHKLMYFIMCLKCARWCKK